MYAETGIQEVNSEMKNKDNSYVFMLAEFSKVFSDVIMSCLFIYNIIVWSKINLFFMLVFVCRLSLV